MWAKKLVQFTTPFESGQFAFCNYHQIDVTILLGFTTSMRAEQNDTFCISCNSNACCNSLYVMFIDHGLNHTKNLGGIQYRCERLVRLER